ncbi:hypothetical protein [Alcanivorax sp.]|uniref:hypothetical protein n=1 Tax=Alcanivorax sp. TaxID=1872427 RepID=UPI0025BDD132|nr:hypothetical protein [Alcanivorax sp.]
MKVRNVILEEMEYKALARKASKLARFLLESDQDYLDNVLEMTKVGQRLVGELWNTDFHVFGEIASDTDHLPMKDVRAHCSVRMLERSDRELIRVIVAYKGEVEIACHSILTKYQGV